MISLTISCLKCKFERTKSFLFYLVRHGGVLQAWKDAADLMAFAILRVEAEHEVAAHATMITMLGGLPMAQARALSFKIRRVFPYEEWGAYLQRRK